jgi:Predicted glycosyltransferases
MEKLAILIPVHNALKYTNEALVNLKSEITGSNWSLNETIYIVVIDDGSTDGTANWIKEHHSDIELCYGDGNLWWSGAINAGAKHAFNGLNCTHVLLWNNDILTGPDYFSNLYNIIQNGNTSSVFGSKIYVKNENLIWFMGGIFSPCSGQKWMIGHKLPDSEKFNQITECDWLTGMGTVVHKSVIEKIGYWDQENFPQYHGDSDFTFRAKKEGFKLIVYPSLKIFNDITHTGVYHNRTFKSLKNSLKSIKSDFNLSKDILFYRKHSTCFIAYWSLFVKYFRYIGGFIKQKYFSF